MLVYPASSGDAFPILCVPNLIMIDQSTFTTDTGYFSQAVKFVDNHPNRPFSFRELSDRLDIGEQTK